MKHLTLILAFCAVTTVGYSGQKPKVLLIIADDLGLQLSCYGHQQIRTPHLDALAAGGMRFKTAYDGTPAQKAMAMLPNPPEWELYDLEADPSQFHNLAADSGHATTLDRMKALLLKWQKETQDPYLDPATLAKRQVQVNSNDAEPKKKN